MINLHNINSFKFVEDYFMAMDVFYLGISSVALEKNVFSAVAGECSVKVILVC